MLTPDEGNGTPNELKADVGPDWADVKLVDTAAFDNAKAAVRAKFGIEAVVDRDVMRVSAPVADGGSIADLLYVLKDAGIAVSDSNYWVEPIFTPLPAG